MSSIKELEPNIQKELEKLLTRTNLPSSTLKNLNFLFVNGQNQLILKVLKNLPNDAYYKATLKLKEHHQQTPKAKKLKQNLIKLQNQFTKLKVSQHISQWSYYCLDILQDIKDQFQDMQREQTRIQEYRQRLNNVLSQYFGDNMSPDRFIQYIINHQNFQHLTLKEIKSLLFVKQKIYPPSKKIIQQRMIIDKQGQKLKMDNLKIQQKKRTQDNSSLDKKQTKNQFSNQNIKSNSNKIFSNNINANNTEFNFNNINNIKGEGAQSNVTYNQNVNQKKTQQNRLTQTGKQSQNIEDQIIKGNKIDIKNQLKNDINVKPNFHIRIQNNFPQKSQDDQIEDQSIQQKSQYSQQLQNQLGYQKEDESFEEHQDHSRGQQQYGNDDY